MGLSETDENSKLACYCNNVSEKTVIEAIQQFQCNSLESIYDKTGAGVGPCGGSCRRVLLKLLSGTNQTSIKSWELPSEVIEALSLFNRKYYWETHEVLEHIWLKETGELKIFYQGLIQAAATYYHVLNNNPKGAIRLSQAALEKLLPTGNIYRGLIDITAVLKSLPIYHEQSKGILDGTLHGFDYSALPLITIITEDLEKKN